MLEGKSFALYCAGRPWVPMASYLWSRGEEWLPETRHDLCIFGTGVAHGDIYTCSVWVSGPGWGLLVSSDNKSITVQCECRDLPPNCTLNRVSTPPQGLNGALKGLDMMSNTPGAPPAPLETPPWGFPAQQL